VIFVARNKNYVIIVIFDQDFKKDFCPPHAKTAELNEMLTTVGQIARMNR
jgi:hypothetical protein